MAKKKTKNWPKLIGAILLCEGVGVAGAFFVGPSISSWYSTLDKPLFSPPNYLFGPVWTILYALMGIALYLLWKNKKPTKLLNLFYLQLILNGVWTPIFFGAHNISLALVDILALWTLILILIFKAWNLDKRISLLLLPYLAWVSFAALLNFSLWQLN